MADEATIWVLVEQLRRRWVLIVMITLGMFAGVTLYVERLPSEYTGRAVVAFAPHLQSDVVPPSADTVRLVVPKYVAYITSPGTIEEIASDTRIPFDELFASTDATIATDTGNVTITVVLESPTKAAAAANALADAAVGFSQNDNVVRGEIVVRAVAGSGASGPPRRLLEIAGLLAGLLVGIAAALLAERGRPRVRSWRDIQQLTGLTVLSKVPRSRVRPWSATASFVDPQVGTAFRTLRTNLELLAEQDKFKVLVVTSATSGEGKSSVSCLLAEVFARLGVKTLLIDADLRRHGLSTGLKLSPGAGLVEVLRSRVPLPVAVRRGWMDNLDVLTSTQDPDASDLIARHFGNVLADARSLYKLTIVDAPPLLGTDEGQTMATLGDAVLFVARVGVLAGPINEGVMALEGLNVRVLGAVANAVPRRQYSANYY